MRVDSRVCMCLNGQSPIANSIPLQPTDVLASASLLVRYVPLTLRCCTDSSGTPVVLTHQRSLLSFSCAVAATDRPTDRLSYTERFNSFPLESASPYILAGVMTTGTKRRWPPGRHRGIKNPFSLARIGYYFQQPTSAARFLQFSARPLWRTTIGTVTLPKTTD